MGFQPFFMSQLKKTEKAILIDYLSSRASKVTILAYVTKQSLAAEYEVAKKCLEIMDETTTRLSFEFEARLRIILFRIFLG